ncbi:HlyD family secretion protein [Halotalea alkalilenta]|uniref:HlyD family secretion protein n=1 Tax=Halotalea alkalilenta TaxID=376489 RepID=UPI0004850158|nr:HlyD family secretion protein [Halotalea alkalilenta]
MTPEQRFNRWVQTALLVFAAAFVYFIVADTHMPMTPESRLLRPVVPVAPQVGGRVSEVLVRNNQHVRKGETLFRIDDRSYRLAVVEAELALEQAERENKELDAQIASAEADLRAAQVEADNQARDLRRYEALAAKQSIAAQVRDQTLAAYRSAEAQVSAAQARISELRTQRGETGEDNLRLRQARNTLDRARLDLDYTEVRADLDGVVSNLQLSAGDYVATGSAALALVGDRPDLVADFREKSLRYAHSGTAAAVTFDGLPGQVFDARVEGYDAGVRNGQLLADGTLADPVESDRWVRDAQRMRVHVSLVEVPERALPTGARATVQLYPGDNPLARLLGRLQIHLVSLIHYVY